MNAYKETLIEMIEDMKDYEAIYAFTFLNLKLFGGKYVVPEESNTAADPLHSEIFAQ